MPELPRLSFRAEKVSVDAYSEGDISTPFGGYKESGFGGRDKGLESFDQYTEKKTIYNALSLAQDHWHLLIANEDLARIVTVGYATPEALSEVDWSRCTNYMFMQFNAWEYLYYQNADGSMPKELWVGADAFHKELVATKPGFVRFWSEFKTSFDEPFRSYVALEFARRAPVTSDLQMPRSMGPPDDF